jgi:hypothetical protein
MDNYRRKPQNNAKTSLADIIAKSTDENYLNFNVHSWGRQQKADKPGFLGVTVF